MFPTLTVKSSAGLIGHDHGPRAEMMMFALERSTGPQKRYTIEIENDSNTVAQYSLYAKALKVTNTESVLPVVYQKTSTTQSGSTAYLYVYEQALIVCGTSLNEPLVGGLEIEINQSINLPMVLSPPRPYSVTVQGQGAIFTNSTLDAEQAGEDSVTIKSDSFPYEKSRKCITLSVFQAAKAMVHCTSTSVYKQSRS